MKQTVITTLAIGAIALASLTQPAAASAQTTWTPCNVGAHTQYDMAGHYVGIDGPLTLDIYPCGGAALVWTDTYGIQQGTAYYSTQPFAGGGYTARVMEGPGVPYFRGPWNTEAIGYKPAERGTIQVMFWLTGSQELKIYRAYKTN